MLAVTISADLLTGAILGLGLGLLFGPLIRSWLAWREFADASRRADLIEDVLDHMDGRGLEAGPDRGRRQESLDRRSPARQRVP